MCTLVHTQRRLMGRHSEALAAAIAEAEFALANGGLAEIVDEIVLPAMRRAAIELAAVEPRRRRAKPPPPPVAESVTPEPPAPAGFTSAAYAAAALENDAA